jgi:uncharacterized protein (TIGR03067 family)
MAGQAQTRRSWRARASFVAGTMSGSWRWALARIEQRSKFRLFEPRRRIMIRQLTAILALGALVLATGFARADDQEKLQGVWKVEKGVEEGDDMSAEEASKMSLEFKENKVIPRRGNRTEKEAEFTLDTSKNPKTIDIKTPEGMTVLGIYEFDGDKLKFCFIKGGERPMKFESPAGSSIRYFVLKKQAK